MWNYGMRRSSRCLRTALSLCLAGISCCASAKAASPAAEDSKPRAETEAVVYEVELANPAVPSEPGRSYSVVQRSDRNGFPVEYSLLVRTPVCTGGKCKTVDVTIFWNSLGYYERLKCPPGKPLTKKEHVPFDAADYAKLDRILRDRNSVLGTHSLATMVQRAADDEGADAWTGPTPVTVQQSVVKDAAYTTWVMWRWANGSIVPELRSLTERRCTPRFLEHLLRSDDRRDVDFALDHILKHSADDGRYRDAVFHVLENGDRDQVRRSLSFLDKAVKDRKVLHARLAESCCRMKQFCSPIVLDYFGADPELPSTTLEELTSRLGRLPYFQVHLTLQLLEARKAFSARIESDVSRLLDSRDFFIARRASEYLVKQQLSPTIRKKLDAFRERNRDRL